MVREDHQNFGGKLQVASLALDHEGSAVAEAKQLSERDVPNEFIENDDVLMLEQRPPLAFGAPVGFRPSVAGMMGLSDTCGAIINIKLSSAGAIRNMESAVPLERFVVTNPGSEVVLREFQLCSTRVKGLLDQKEVCTRPLPRSNAFSGAKLPRPLYTSVLLPAISSGCIMRAPAGLPMGTSIDMAFNPGKALHTFESHVTLIMKGAVLSTLLLEDKIGVLSST